MPTHISKAPSVSIELLTLLAPEQHADTTACRRSTHSILLAVRQRVAMAAGVQVAAVAVVVEALAAGLAGWVGGWEVTCDELGEVESGEGRVERRGGREDSEHVEEEELEDAVEDHGGDFEGGWLCGCFKVEVGWLSGSD
jgi:hypothetical protein